MVLEKTLASPLDWKEIQPVHSKGGQSWVFIGRIDAEPDRRMLKAEWCQVMSFKVLASKLGPH